MFCRIHGSSVLIAQLCSHLYQLWLASTSALQCVNVVIFKLCLELSFFSACGVICVPIYIFGCTPQAIHKLTRGLMKCGCEHTLQYNPIGNIRQTTYETKNRKRNIIWFNPPFSKNVSTNIGKNFLNLINKHFPINNEYRKIFNHNTLKISYSCITSSP